MRVRKKDTGEKRGRQAEEDGHVPSEHATNLTVLDSPHTTAPRARKLVHPFSRHPCRAAGQCRSKTRQTKHCYSIGSGICPPVVPSPLIHASLPSLYSLVAVTAVIFDTGIRTILARLVVSRQGTRYISFYDMKNDFLRNL